MTATMTPGLMTSNEDIARFILGGKATFTVRSLKSQERYTFKVSHKKADDSAKVPPYFVGLLSGPNNETDYTYLGAIFDDGQFGEFRLTRASKMKADSLPVRVFNWIFKMAMTGDPKLLQQAEVWHEGQCCVCGRKLTDPESIASGIGPKCLANGGF